MSTAVTGARAGSHRAWVGHVMSMPISVHVRGDRAREPEVADAVEALFTDLRESEARFSPFRPDSELSRFQRGEVPWSAASADLRELDLLCRVALERTEGWFDAWAVHDDSRFDPTGLTKTWAVSRAARHLSALDVGYAVGAGGDVLVRSTDSEPWLVGVEDPRDRSQVLAAVPVTDGGVATSGIAARGAHIRNPRTGRPATEVLSATVVGPSLLWADVLATTAVARGAASVDLVAQWHGTSGLLVLADGTVHRWANPA